MLERVTIRDLVLVEHAEVTFGPGLTVVTGETGAGKTLLVRAVELLVGGRADTDAVREGARAAIVEGEFRPRGDEAVRRVRALLEDWGVPDEGDGLLVRREIQAGGRSRAWVNATQVTRAALQTLGEAMADLHGQHEHQSLLRADAGVETLDRLGGLGAERARYAETLAAWRAATDALGTLEATLATHAQHRAWMTEAAAELDDARLVPGEEETLKQEAARLAHADRLQALIAQALDRLADGEAAALDAIGAAERAVEQAAAIDPSLAPALPTLDEARIAAAEAARVLGAYAASLEADPAALEAVETRREQIARLVRRHQRSVEALIAWREELAQALAIGADAEGARARARELTEGTVTACRAAGRALSRRRQAAAKTWSRTLTGELAPLGFPHAALRFVVTPRGEGDTALAADGLDQVEILFAANPGEPARPLQKIASGGELSRVMLALKTALEAQDPVDLLLFDEVDSGIGGAVARAVGERLRRLSAHRQVVCVTHLPMIAALATHHLRVTKHVAGGRTVARIERVEARERVEELARMLAGDRITDTTRRQARELMAERIGPAVSG